MDFWKLRNTGWHKEHANEVLLLLTVQNVCVIYKDTFMMQCIWQCLKRYLGEEMKRMVGTESVMFMWLILVIIFIVVEILTLGLTTIWFAGGAMIALFAQCLGVPLPLQLGLFFGVSLLLFFFVRPSACAKFNKNFAKTDLDCYIQAEGKVLETIDNFNQKGAVLLQGKEWTARSQDDTVIPAGSCVIVTEISGVKLIVRKKQEDYIKNVKEN